MNRQAWIQTAIAAAWFVIAPQAAAQQWPDKPVRILIPFPPGGGTDIQGRLFANAFQKSMGQNFIVDNRTGASGIIATQLAVEAPPDGSTILFTSGSLSVIVTLHAKRIKFDVHNDLAPVSWISSTPLVLSLHPSVPVKSVKELVALAKRTPGGLNAAGNSAGSTAHLSAEMLNQFAGIKSTVLTYRGGGPAVLALISGEADYLFATAPSIMPHLKTGKAKALAVTTPKRSSALPELPTMNSIYPGFESDNWYAMFFPKGTPRAVVDRLNAEIKKALQTPEIKSFLPHEALDPVASSPEELADLLKREIPKYAKVIERAHIRAD
jgi:tripartite-type tricarboxylate transporter receptor subunit TctC